jgi:hypothetical protein
MNHVIGLVTRPTPGATTTRPSAVSKLVPIVLGKFFRPLNAKSFKISNCFRALPVTVQTARRPKDCVDMQEGLNALFSTPNNQCGIDYRPELVFLIMRFDDFVFEFAFSAYRTSTSHPKRGLRHNCPYIGTDDYLIEPVRVICFRSSRLLSLTLWLRPSYVHSSLGISGSRGGTQLLNAFILCCIRCIRLSEMTMSWRAMSRASILDGFCLGSTAVFVTN